MSKLRLAKKGIELRQLEVKDAPRLAELANDKKIWDYVRDYFPHPYSIKDARSFITQVRTENPSVTFAILNKKELVGCIGVKYQTDIYRKSGEVGYWVGTPYHGQGIASIALELITQYGLKKLGFNRLFAGVFSNNPASMRVLEKCGYQYEGLLKNAIWKNNQYLDEHRYAYIVKE